jgi:hypothetical protein
MGLLGWRRKRKAAAPLLNQNSRWNFFGETAARQSFLFSTHLAHVRFWHLADIPSCTAHVRFRGKSGHLETIFLT